MVLLEGTKAAIFLVVIGILDLILIWVVMKDATGEWPHKMFLDDMKAWLRKRGRK